MSFRLSKPPKIITSLFCLLNVVVFSGCTSVKNNIPRKTENIFEDKHIMLDGFSQTGNKLTLNLKCCYSVENIYFEARLYDDNGFYIDEFREEHLVQQEKNKVFSLACNTLFSERIDTVRFRLIRGKTYDKVDSNYTIDCKTYYFDYLNYSPSNITTLLASESVSPNMLPTKRFTAPNLGPYTFSGWEYTDEAGSSKTYSYNVRATSNLIIRPDYTYSESKHKSIMQGEQVYKALVKTERTYYDKILFIPVPDLRIQGSGVIYKKSGNDYYVLTCAHCVKNLKEYDKYTDKIYIDGSTFNSTVVKVDQTCDLAILKFTSTKNYSRITFAINSYPGLSFPAIGSIGSPGGNYNQISLGKFIGNREIINGFGFEMNTIRFSNCLGPGCSGGGVFNCVGELIGISSNGDDQSSEGYAVPIETVKKFVI